MSVDFAFLDSGTGGLPYMSYLNKICPEASCVYVADAQNFPYGTKSAEEVENCALSVCKKIIQLFSPKVIVVACNTMSVTALSALRKAFKLPIIGTVPAVKLAASLTKNHRLGLLATSRSIAQPYTKKLIKDFASNCEVFSLGDDKLISFIEHNLTTATKSEKIAASLPAIDFFKSKDVDTIILGCTHFINFAEEIAEAAGPSIQVIDSREGVVRQALKKLGKAEGSLPENTLNKTFYITGTPKDSSEQDYENIAKSFNIPWGGYI